jgi:hypothetical protein
VAQWKYAAFQHANVAHRVERPCSAIAVKMADALGSEASIAWVTPEGRRPVTQSYSGKVTQEKLLSKSYSVRFMMPNPAVRSRFRLFLEARLSAIVAAVAEMVIPKLRDPDVDD